jgi:hypothetical protein
MKLKKYHEFIGTLEKYEIVEDELRLRFTIEYKMELPRDAFPTTELDDCIQRQIGIFNNDGDYRLRKFPRGIDVFKSESCPKCEKQKECSKEGLELFNCLLKKIVELKKKHE